MKYIVLLRGINISGKNKIAMSELKNILESNNYSNVITYLNSGNVILNSDNSKEYIADDIKTLIKKNFNLEIPVYVIEHLELKDILEHNPIWWGDLPPIVYTFIESYNFEGKTVIPFNTHEGSGSAGTYNTFKSKLTKANVNTDGLALKGSTSRTDKGKDETINWLKKLGY